MSHPRADFSYTFAVEHEGTLSVGSTQKTHAANELVIIPIDTLQAAP